MHEKLLVGITSYGPHHWKYLDRVLREYSSMDFRTRVVVFVDEQRTLGWDIEQVAKDVEKDPCSLTWAHREFFAAEKDNYDLFLYTEDDVLVTERNIRAWIAANENLGDGETVPGFFIKERRESDGLVNYPQAHCSFSWNQYINERGDRKFCHFSNVHSACCLLSVRQLGLAILSGKYVAAAHSEPTYQMRELACSGPFVECGLTKLICVSHFDDFTVEHLPGNYIGVLGTPENVIRQQVTAMGGQVW